MVLTELRTLSPTYPHCPSLVCKRLNYTVGGADILTNECDTDGRNEESDVGWSLILGSGRTKVCCGSEYSGVSLLPGLCLRLQGDYEGKNNERNF